MRWKGPQVKLGVGQAPPSTVQQLGYAGTTAPCLSPRIWYYQMVNYTHPTWAAHACVGCKLGGQILTGF